MIRQIELPILALLNPHKTFENIDVWLTPTYVDGLISDIVLISKIQINHFKSVIKESMKL